MIHTLGTPDNRFSHIPSDLQLQFQNVSLLFRGLRLQIDSPEEGVLLGFHLGKSIAKGLEHLERFETEVQCVLNVLLLNLLFFEDMMYYTA